MKKPASSWMVKLAIAGLVFPVLYLLFQLLLSMPIVLILAAAGRDSVALVKGVVIASRIAALAASFMACRRVWPAS